MGFRWPCLQAPQSSVRVTRWRDLLTWECCCGIDIAMTPIPVDMSVAEESGCLLARPILSPLSLAQRRHGDIRRRRRRDDEATEAPEGRTKGSVDRQLTDNHLAANHRIVQTSPRQGKSLAARTGAIAGVAP